MADTLSREERSRRMGLIPSKGSKPELAVRRMVHRLGYRFRLHRRDLPGTPDLVFASRRAVMFVHGCFWHRHEGCSLARLPKSRLEFWRPKLDKNKARDARKISELKATGWRVGVVWECQLGDKDALETRLRAFLDGKGDLG